METIVKEINIFSVDTVFKKEDFDIQRNLSVYFPLSVSQHHQDERVFSIRAVPLTFLTRYAWQIGSIATFSG